MSCNLHVGISVQEGPWELRIVNFYTYTDIHSLRSFKTVSPLHRNNYKKSFLSDFLQSLFWGSSDVACSGHAKERDDHCACFQVTGRWSCRIWSFCMHINGELNHFWLKEHVTPFLFFSFLFGIKQFIYMRKQAVKIEQHIIDTPFSIKLHAVYEILY